jgi:hypothetical protein
VHEIEIVRHAIRDRQAVIGEVARSWSAPETLAVWSVAFGPLNTALVLREATDPPQAARVAPESVRSRDRRLLQPRKPFRAHPEAKVFEFRTYSLRPDVTEEYVEKLMAALPIRERYSPNAGVWTSMSGLADQLLHVWPYSDLAQRNEVRAALQADHDWESFVKTIVDLIEDQVSWVLTPVAPTAGAALGRSGA